jgi:hypothetical protein
MRFEDFRAQNITVVFFRNVIIGSEVLTAAVMKNSVFWDITLCSPLEVNRCFGGTYWFHFQG